MQVTHGAELSSLRDWSPDGTSFAVSDDRDGDYDIYLVRSNGGERKVTRAGGDELDPQWTRDGAASRLCEAPSNAEIYVINVDGTDCTA